VKKRMVVAVVLAVLMAASAYAQTTNFLELVKTGTPHDVRAAVEKGADLNARDIAYGSTPLIDAAAYNSNPEVVTILLRAGADMEARDSAYGCTALMWAAIFNRNPDVVTTLLKAGADINARSTSEGMTALLWTARQGADPAGMIMVLLKAGADAKVKDKVGKIAFDYARLSYELQGTDALKQLEEASK
jgi:uncharacterized protein